MRFSWHMIEGRARTAHDSWDFRWQALTCDEPAHLITWLRSVACASAAAGEAWPRRAEFTEPNLALEVIECGESRAALRVELDLEFRAPGQRGPRGVGHPSVLEITSTPAQLIAAADDLRSDLLRFPDGLNQPDEVERDWAPSHNPRLH